MTQLSISDKIYLNMN